MGTLRAGPLRAEGILTSGGITNQSRKSVGTNSFVVFLISVEEQELRTTKPTVKGKLIQNINILGKVN